MRVLVIEDDAQIAADIARALEAAGFRVEQTDDGEQAWFLGDTEEYTLIVLDLGLARLDGLTVLTRWRAAGRTMPVLILTARGSWVERVEGIDAGADDYLPKPFQMEELVARARALVRRSTGQAHAVLEAGPISLDTRRMQVRVNGVPTSLAPMEYRLLAYLMHHRGRVVPITELLEQLYGLDEARDANAIEALVARLRRKLGAATIQTRRGFGYLIPDVSP
jgi:DNA-binding response OmpR family regulator